jgi:LacI family transcriptional regulator
MAVRGGVVGTRIKLDVIAAAAHVSTPTVSKVLNGRPDVAPKTRRHIENVLKELGYTHRPPRPRRVGLIDLIFNDLSPWATDIIRGASNAALLARTRLAVSLIPTGEAVECWLRSLDRSRTDGVVLVTTDLAPSHRERLAELQAPVVLVDPVTDPVADLPSIGADNWSGARAATEHLIALGHRRIATITGRPSALCTWQRLDGYRAALAAAGLRIDPALIAEGDFRSDSASAAADALLRLPDPPTAVFTASDQQAMAVYEAARHHGLHIPDDLSVVGFDDIPTTGWMSPPLTTVRQPLAEMAALAVRVLLAADPVTVRRQDKLPTELVIRASTAPPRRVS